MSKENLNSLKNLLSQVYANSTDLKMDKNNNTIN